MFRSRTRSRKHSTHPRRARTTCPLRVERLEDRSLLSYTFQSLALLNSPAPGPEGGHFINDFEAGQLNNNGQVIFTADLDTGGEGVFLGSAGGLTQLMRDGESAPGGGTFGGFGSLSTDTINNSGDAAFGFTLNPFTLPVNVNAGVYRYNHSDGNLSAVLVPFVTPA